MSITVCWVPGHKILVPANWNKNDISYYRAKLHTVYSGYKYLNKITKAYLKNWLCGNIWSDSKSLWKKLLACLYVVPLFLITNTLFYSAPPFFKCGPRKADYIRIAQTCLTWEQRGRGLVTEPALGTVLFKLPVNLMFLLVQVHLHLLTYKTNQLSVGFFLPPPPIFC